MSHEEVLEELYGLERFGIKLGLANIKELLHRLGDPQLRLKAVHVTGSNGKGSVCAFVESVLREAGYDVGMYTSPHLIRFNERIKVGGREISNDDIVRLYELIRTHATAMAAESKAKQPTFFEITTTMAFLYFVEKEVDLAVVEVGMGGGMDATNVVTPEVCVITRIGLEHTDHLGKTIRRISREKSGILKPGVPVVTLEQEALPVVEERAKELGCPVHVVGRDAKFVRVGGSLAGQTVDYSGSFQMRVETAMLGGHQAENAALALTAIGALESRGWEVSDDAKRRGIARMRWTARFQVIRRSPPVVIDGAHNPPGMQSLRKALEEYFPGNRIVFVAGVLNDKDLASIVSAIAPLAAHVIATKARSERAFSPEEVAGEFKKHGASVETAEDVASAIRRALALSSREMPVCITGSLYVSGEALQFFQEGGD